MVDFNPSLQNAISNLINFGKRLANDDGGNNKDVIENDARITFGATVHNVAKSEGIDESQLYAETNIASLMGAEFSGNTPKIDPIMAEMAALFDDVDQTKLNKYMTAAIESNTMSRVSNTTDKVSLITEAFTNKPVFNDDDLNEMWAMAGIKESELTATQEVYNKNYQDVAENGINPDAFFKTIEEYFG